MTTLQKSDHTKTMARLAALVVAASLLTACSSKKNSAGLGLGANGQNPNAVGYAGGNRYGSGPVTPGTERDFTVNVGNKVFFETDSSRLTADAQETLRGQAKWLNQYPNHTITIEGHSDERGTREYNLGLAAKRAQMIKNFLAQQGVNSARLRTISYGKERPVAMCEDISCWSQNRRGVTLLNKRG
jgi:peptidoglycan-associated lipoprotein